MRKQVVGLVAATAFVVASCGGEATSSSSNEGPFVGKVEFEIGMMGMNMGGELIVDAENQKAMYKLDGLEMILGADMRTIVDWKQNKMYMISPEKNMYHAQDMNDQNVENELPSKEDIQEMKEDIEENLSATGNSMTIAGFEAQEYEVTGKLDEIESGKMWFSKDLMNQLLPAFETIPEFKELSLSDAFPGIPVKADIGEGFENISFEVKNVTKGIDVSDSFNISSYEQLTEDEFMTRLMEGTDLGGLLQGLEGIEGLEMETEAFGEGMEEFGESLDDILKQLEDLDVEIDEEK